jgi:uncharacterized heparinase superfamily protein
MIERRRTDSPPDEALAREIEGLMGVDPSPEFLARVSSCLAEESALLGSRVLGPHKQWSTLLTGSIRLFDCLRHVIRQRVVTPSRQLALTTVILAVLAAPSIYRAVRDRQRYTHVHVEDQLLLDSIGANVSRAVPQVLEPLMQPLSADKSYSDGTDDTGGPR